MNAASPTEGRRRALITGIAGFTGRYLAAELGAAGYEVFGTVQAQDVGGAGHLACDLLDADRVRAVVAEVRPDVVAHLAAVSFVGHGDLRRDLRDQHRRHAQPAAGARRAGHAAVGGAAGEQRQRLRQRRGRPYHRGRPPAPANDYAVSKLAMEHAARLHAGRLPIVIVRPFNYTGVGQAPHFLLPKIVDHFRRGDRRIELGNLDVARDFSDVRDVVVVYRRLIERAPPGTLVNVSRARRRRCRRAGADGARSSATGSTSRSTPPFVAPTRCVAGRRHVAPAATMGAWSARRYRRRVGGCTRLSRAPGACGSHRSVTNAG